MPRSGCKPEDLDLWYVRNNTGEMVPFSTFTSGHWSFGSPRLERFNGNPAVEIVGEAAPGKSSGDAMKIIGELVAQLPAGIGYEWTGASYPGAAGRRPGSRLVRHLDPGRLSLSCRAL